MKKNILVLFLLFCSLLVAQQNVRVMSYNIHNYPNGQDANIKKIINTINPDALVIVEMLSQSGVNQFLSSSLSIDYKTASVTIRSSDSNGNNGNDCAFYYKSSVLTLIETQAIPARTRVISKFKLVHNTTKDTLIVLGVHLKANDYTSDNVLNAQKRTEAVTTMMNETKNYNSKTNYLLCGDFNIFSSNESAFQKMVDKSQPGYFIDMMNANGNWSDNPSFASICTHSTTDLDTRLDMILVSPAIISKGGIDYIDGSFKIFGNDGKHYNQSVTTGVNDWFAMDATIGSALVQASDHLPIYADFQFGVPTNIQIENQLPMAFELMQNYPNPFNPSTAIRYKIPAVDALSSVELHVTLKVYDVLGKEIATLVDEEKQSGTYSVLFTFTRHGRASSTLGSGIYFYRLTAGNFSAAKKMIFLQ